MKNRNQQSKLRNLLHLGAIIAFALGLTYCANIKPPEGGKKDTLPPKPKKINPPNKSLHFTADKIEITFDEYIKATGFVQTLISPPMEKKPNFSIQGKTLVIKLKSKLRDSTTYTINFAEDIKDVNEGNILNNFSYVFSTGDFIDSQKVAGAVKIARDNSPADGVIVSLYPEDSIDAIKRSKPYYFAKTDKQGNFKIGNIKAGSYRIFGLKDQNYNYIYDQPNEMIAFSDSIWLLKDTLVPKVELNLFEEAPAKMKLIGTQAIAPGNVQIYLNQPYHSLEIARDSEPAGCFWYPNSTKDTINYWYSDYYKHRTKLYITINDTINDTARVELNYITIDSLTQNKKYALSLVNQANSPKPSGDNKDIINVQDLYKPLKLSFGRPILKINQLKPFRLTADSAKKEIPASFEIAEKNKLALLINFTRDENSYYTLEVPDSAFSDIFGVWNKKFTYKFKTNAKDNYGNLNITLKTNHPEKHYIVKLMNEAGETIMEIPFAGDTIRKLSVTNLLAGNYKFMAIDDRNNNGHWDTGSFRNKTQPERVINFKDTYYLKGGWDLDAEVICN